MLSIVWLSLLETVLVSTRTRTAARWHVPRRPCGGLEAGSGPWVAEVILSLANIWVSFCPLSAKLEVFVSVGFKPPMAPVDHLKARAMSTIASLSWARPLAAPVARSYRM